MTKMEELLSYIKGPVISGKPVYQLRSCLECFDDKALSWMMEICTTSDGSDGSDESRQDQADADEQGSKTRSEMITAICQYVTNPQVIEVLLRTDDTHFIENTVVEMGQADGLWADEQDGSGDQVTTSATSSLSSDTLTRIDTLKNQARELDLEANTYYPQYKGQFETEAEYKADRERHYAEIEAKLNTVKSQLEALNYTEKAFDTPAEVSLVFNSRADARLKTLQQAGVVFLFTEWDGKGRESGYHFGLDVNWAMLPKRNRDDPWSSVYNKGRAVYERQFFNCETLIGAQPFKPRLVTRNGVKVWTTEPGRGQKAPEDDVCLRLVVPVEIQKLVYERMQKSMMMIKPASVRVE